jgi:hypothetical protein
MIGGEVTFPCIVVNLGSLSGILRIMIGGEVTFPCIVVNLDKFVSDLEDHDWRRGYLSLHCCQLR